MFVLSYECNKPIVNKISIISKNGGPNGFNSCSQFCQDNIGLYEFRNTDSGHCKLEFYKPLLKNKNIKTVLDSATLLINLNKSIEKELTTNDYKLKLVIQDKFNYNYEITKK